MATVTESPTTTVRLTQDAATALLKEARSQFDNGARELYRCGDESVHATIAACTEIIGRLDGRPWRWPHVNTPHGREPAGLAEFEFTATTLDWIEVEHRHTAEHVADLDSGDTGGSDPGYHAGEVFLLHVLRGILEQAGRKAAA